MSDTTFSYFMECKVYLFLIKMTPKNIPGFQRYWNQVLLQSRLKWNNWCQGQGCPNVHPSRRDHSNNLQNGGGLIKWGLVYWLEIVHSALVRETILYSSMLRILFLVWSSDLPLRISKKIFIGLFFVFGNLEHFLFFLYPQDQKRVDFAIFWLLASRKEENFYLQVEKVDSGIPDIQQW